MLREIRLYGELGRRFGRVHHMAVDSVGEAIRALMANFTDFERSMIEYRPGFKVWAGSSRIAEAEDINDPTSAREVIRIAPIVAGAAKSGLTQFLIGAAIITAAVMSGGTSLGATALWGTTTVATLAGSIGFALALGGVAQMLSPQKELDPSGSERAASSPSYVFNGPVNTSAQGHPVPVGYGRLIIGSAVISAGISTEDISV